MMEGSVSAEDLLHKVDKTAKAVSTVSKQQVLAGLRGDHGDSGTTSAASSYYGDEAAPNSQNIDQPPAPPSTTTSTARPLPRSTLGAKPLSGNGGRPPRNGSTSSSRKGSTNSLQDASRREETKDAAAAAAAAVAPIRNKAPPSSIARPQETEPTALPKNTSVPVSPTKIKEVEKPKIAPSDSSLATRTAVPPPPPSSSSSVIAKASTKKAGLSKPPSIAESIDSEITDVASVSIPPSVENDKEEEGDLDDGDGKVASTTSSAAGGGVPASTSTAPSNPSNPTNASDGLATPEEKIARLSRLVQGLKQKVQRLQNENLQLEEMLAAADVASKGGSGEIYRLEDALAKEQAARVSVEASLRGALAAKEGEVVTLKEQLHASTTRAAQLAEAVAVKEAEHAQIEADRSIGESQLLATLRKEIEVAEATLEEERKAHAAARRASAAREQQLDSSVAEAAASLTAMQRMVEERTAKATVAEERCRELEIEIEKLGHLVALAEKSKADSQAIAAAGGDGDGDFSGTTAAGSNNTNSVAAQRVEELELTLSEVRRNLSAAEAAAASSNIELNRLRSEMEILRRQLAEARSSDSADLRRRLQEATDALYSKQAQLERATADKAATQLQLERQMSTVTNESLKRRTAAVDRILTGGEDAYGIVPMDESTLGDTYARLANAPGHLGHAVKTGARFLDSSASQAVRVLRHYPLGRLAVFCYIVGMHLFIYLLLHRLQHRAFSHLTAVEAHDHLAVAGGGALLSAGAGAGSGGAVNASN